MTPADDGRRDLNEITLRGRLGRDPEIRTTQSGFQIVNLSVATEERWKDRATQEWTGRTTWHRVTVKFADVQVNTAMSLEKGQRVLIKGKMTYREYETAAGEKRSSAEIEVSRFGELQPIADDREPPPASSTRRAPAAQSVPKPAYQDDDLDSEIPF